MSILISRPMVESTACFGDARAIISLCWRRETSNLTTMSSSTRRLRVLRMDTLTPVSELRAASVESSPDVIRAMRSSTSASTYGTLGFTLPAASTLPSITGATCACQTFSTICEYRSPSASANREEAASSHPKKEEPLLPSSSDSMKNRTLRVISVDHHSTRRLTSPRDDAHAILMAWTARSANTSPSASPRATTVRARRLAAFRCGLLAPPFFDGLNRSACFDSNEGL
mmetsp:Transcript_14100/g.40326  ORF Transcript_14100/g.40326 Transcript_14100/m.40326 type:complete len:229 (-) Transcript_14100:415-1101(-)